MTGAPIYLVSACASGEEFVAAFRRYADKNGLFIPIAEPLQVGRHARFAVTLRDGGVMIEGSAEVISSAHTPSVLHGRVGMTLRFLEPDEASQTTLSELERARLAMRPAPPSIPPRPAEIPADPRPVPPPVHGRVDAVNALAQCVAIGDPEPPEPPAAPRTRTKSLPPVGPASRMGPPQIPTQVGTGVPARAPLVAHATAMVTPSTPPPIASARATTMTGAAPAPLPPPSPVPLHVAAAPSAPTQIGGVVVDALPSSDPAISVVPMPLGDASEEGSARTQVEGGAPPPPAPPIVAAPRSGLLEVEVAEPTDISQVPPVDPPDAESDAAADPTLDEPLRPRRTSLGFVAVTAMPRPAAPTTAVSPDPRFPPVVDELTPSEAWSMPPDGDAWSGAGASLEARTTTDRMTAREPTLPRLPVPDEPTPVEVSPTRETVSMRKALPIDEVPTGMSEVPIGEIPTEATPAGEIVPPPIPADGAASAVQRPPGSLPTGDWTISLDPSAPDGWTAPLRPIAPDPHADGLPGELIDAQPVGHTPGPDDMLAEPKVQIDPTLIEPVPIDGNPAPDAHPPFAMLAGMPPAAALQPGAPTIQGMMPLDRQLRPMPPDGPPGLFENQFVTTPQPGAIEAPPMSMAMAVAQPGPLLMQRGAATHAGPAAAYPRPDYQMSSISMMGSTPGSMTGAYDARFTGDTAPVRIRQRRIIIVLVSALVAAVVGIAVLLATGDSRDGALPAGSDAQRRTRSSLEPASKPIAPAGTSPGDPAAPPPPATDQAPAATGRIAASPPAPAAAAAAAPGARACFADVSSAPPGADIVIDENRVIGTTPQKVALPCGKPIDLVIRKARLVAVTRTVTPTREGARVRVALARPTFLVKVSTTPPGATITLNGRPLGVTPTTVKVPAFESSVLMLVKDGFATETETVAPKANGLSVHADLKRIEHKKPW